MIKLILTLVLSFLLMATGCYISLVFPEYDCVILAMSGYVVGLVVAHICPIWCKK